MCRYTFMSLGYFSMHTSWWWNACWYLFFPIISKWNIFNFMKIPIFTICTFSSALLKNYCMNCFEYEYVPRGARIFIVCIVVLSNLASVLFFALVSVNLGHKYKASRQRKENLFSDHWLKLKTMFMYQTFFYVFWSDELSGLNLRL